MTTCQFSKEGENMNIRERIEQFNRENEPFYLVDHDDSKFSLCYLIQPTPFRREMLCQDLFNEYAESLNEPFKVNGLYTHGSGYEWEHIFRKAFESDPDIGEISFDCEGGGFFCYADSIDTLEDFGHRFREICNDENAFRELVFKGIPEGVEREAREAEEYEKARQNEPVKKKPDCPLIGQDGNIFNLMGIASRTLKNHGMYEEASEMLEKVTSSKSYYEALGVIGDYVNITSCDDDDEDFFEDDDEGMDMDM